MKAFDRFLLLKFGFHPRFVELIMNNLDGSRFFVVFYGSYTGFFKSSRGLKLGDPLSLYLFILLVKVLSHGLTTIVQDGCLASY